MLRRLLIPLAILLLIAWSVFVSPPAVAWLFTSDNQINSAKAVALLWFAAAALIAATIGLAWLSRSRWRRAASVVATIVVVATPLAAWLYWLANPNRHHWHQPLSPAAALAQITVPPGFRVELVAAEPHVVNPVALAFDDRGRIWISESIEYPRRTPGPGKDRIKILEDTDRDGTADKVTIFADGLNMPTGLALGYGGVWVLNSPDLLFLEDTDGDDVADRREVVLTGFGRNDPHEFPSSLAWGPDGWLYGLNGISNPSRIEHQGERFEFSCAMYRLHPRSRKFEVFCEGTSNPWGLAWNNEGSAFVSACVIDHLWHFAEGVYYRNQSGHYPAGAWPAPSIVEHQHQSAAYCGLEFYDSDAYPREYRERLYMGNLHGGCVNVDRATRTGATYFAQPEADFFHANDGWFMPVAIKTGPEGCLYVLDWYDRYHCHQDAQRDPEGVDRLRGRLYRVLHESTAVAPPPNLAEQTNAQLCDLLSSGNGFERRTAQRLLQERLSANADEALRAELEAMVFEPALARRTRLHALWSLIGGDSVSEELLQSLLHHDDATFCAWGVRAAGHRTSLSPAITSRLAELAAIPSPIVQAEVAIVANMVPGLDALALQLDVLEYSPADRLLPHLVWQQLLPHLSTHSLRFRERVTAADLNNAPNLAAVVPRALQRLLDANDSDSVGNATLLAELIAASDPSSLEAARQSLFRLAERVQTGTLSAEATRDWQTKLQPDLQKSITSADHPLFLPALALLASWSDPPALERASQLALDDRAPAAERAMALAAYLAGSTPAAALQFAQANCEKLMAEPGAVAEALLAALGRLDDPAVGELFLARYAELPPSLQTRAVDLLTSRATWAAQLVDAIERRSISPELVNLEQVRKLQALPDPALAKRAAAIWGAVRQARDPSRAAVVERMKKLLRQQRGDADRGARVFQRTCSQCHKFQGAGQVVGPDLTTIGRNNADQLLSNVFDPNLVISAGYQTRMIATDDGRVLTGLLAEETPERIILRLPGGKQETIPRDEIDEIVDTHVSLMPEGLERQMTPQEIADLFAFLLPER